MQQTAVCLSDETKAHCQNPQIVRRGDDLFVAWNQSWGTTDSIVIVQYGPSWQEIARRETSVNGRALMFSVCTFQQELFVCWTEKIEQEWGLYLQKPFGPDGEAPTEIARARGIFNPSIASAADKLYMTWEQLDPTGQSAILLASFANGTVTQLPALPAKSDCYRPKLVIVGGTPYLCYDAFDGEKYAVFFTGYAAGWKEPIQLSQGQDWSFSPALCHAADGCLTAVWYEIHPKGRVSYWTCELDVTAGITAKSSELVNLQIWYSWNNLAADAAHQVLLTGHNMSQFYIRLRGTNGVFTNAVLATDITGLESAIQANVVIVQEKLLVVYQHSNCNGHQERYASIRAVELPLQQLREQDESALEAEDLSFYSAIAQRKTIDELNAKEKQAWLQKHRIDGDVFFGDIHGQSSMSDGLGTVDGYFNYARVKTKQDFSALTDHDVFPDSITHAEWEYVKTISNAFNEKDGFATLLAYEWTPNELRYDFGHKNIYFPGDDGELCRCNEGGSLTPVELFAAVKRQGAIAIPHHTAATWGTVSAATDWDFHDAEVQTSVEIFSRHASFEYEGAVSKYSKNRDCLRGKFVQDALARGYKLGFVGGSDSHQLEHGLEGGLTAAYMPVLSRGALFQSLCARTTYATTGAKMLMNLRINGAQMGSEIQLTEPGSTLRIEMAVLGTMHLKQVELICNNEVVFGCVPAAKEFEQTIDLKMNSDGYFYLRATQNDDHQCWSSPIWINMGITP